MLGVADIEVIVYYNYMLMLLICIVTTIYYHLSTTNDNPLLGSNELPSYDYLFWNLKNIKKMWRAVLKNIKKMWRGIITQLDTQSPPLGIKHRHTIKHIRNKFHLLFYQLVLISSIILITILIKSK